jgi:GAF domain-containing protein
MRDRHDEAVGMPAAVRALAGIMLGDAHPDAVLRRACDATKAVIVGADDVSVTLIENDVPRTAAAIGDLALTADQLQYEAGEGPCLEAARAGAPMLVTDITAEGRWPAYTTAALDVGVRGSLSVPLEVDASVVGALNIYARRAAAFDDDIVDVAYDLAHYTGIVATATDEWNRATTLANQMQQAMESRAVIEQAKGILMAQRRCSPEEAFEVLVRLSQESHRKLRDVARLMVDQIVSR